MRSAAGGNFFLVVYIWRGEVRHIITAWKVGLRGRQRYQALFARRDHGLAGAGRSVRTPDDAPEIELDEEFWEKARIVATAPQRKSSVHLRVDPETLAFFRAGGRGHLTRMAKVLKAYAQSESRRKA
ncbi:MAG: BrnA antitoxin family protein [Geminicoccaceae bacterium]